MKLEWAPEPKHKCLDDMTSFDTYLQGTDADGELVGIGNEVKYTERGYGMVTLPVITGVRVSTDCCLRGGTSV